VRKLVASDAFRVLRGDFCVLVPEGDESHRLRAVRREEATDELAAAID
jgi:hypothetical protein